MQNLDKQGCALGSATQHSASGRLTLAKLVSRAADILTCVLQLLYSPTSCHSQIDFLTTQSSPFYLPATYRFWCYSSKLTQKLLTRCLGHSNEKKAKYEFFYDYLSITSTLLLISIQSLLFSCKKQVLFFLIGGHCRDKFSIFFQCLYQELKGVLHTGLRDHNSVLRHWLLKS